MLDALAHDTSLWVALSFALFAFIAYRLGKNSVLSGLDSKIDAIRKEIATAESLRQEAQNLLSQYQQKQKDAEAESVQIVRQAEANAARIQASAEAELAETMNRREQQLTERLARLEKNALAEIQSHAAELAVKATMEIILKTLDEKTNKSLIDETVKKLPTHLN